MFLLFSLLMLFYMLFLLLLMLMLVLIYMWSMCGYRLCWRKWRRYWLIFGTCWRRHHLFMFRFWRKRRWGWFASCVCRWRRHWLTCWWSLCRFWYWLIFCFTNFIRIDWWLFLFYLPSIFKSINKVIASLALDIMLSWVYSRLILFGLVLNWLLIMLDCRWASF